MNKNKPTHVILVAGIAMLKFDYKLFGVVYEEDKGIVQKAIEQLKDCRVYPKKSLVIC